MEVVEGSLARPRPEWPEAPAAAARLLAADTTLLRVCCSREPGLAGAGQRLQYSRLSRLDTRLHSAQYLCFLAQARLAWLPCVWVCEGEPCLVDSGDPRPWPDLPRQLGTLPPCCGGSQGQQGPGVYRRQSPGMRASCAGSEADWRSFSSCVRWSVAWNIILEF